jgi:hypothetical protein
MAGEKMYRHWPEFEAQMMSGMGSALPEGLMTSQPARLPRRRHIQSVCPTFFFGCESDDPTLNYAFASRESFGAKLGALLIRH